MPMRSKQMISRGLKTMDDQTLHWWAEAMETSVIISLVAAAMAAAFLMSSEWMSKKFNAEIQARKDTAFDKYKVDAGVLIAEARKEGVEAGKAANDAKLRAAELEKEAALARLETEKIKAVVAWRSISAANATKLEQFLAAKPGSVNLRYMDGDPEALFLAIQLSQILAKAGWQVAPGAVKPSNAIVFGIALPDTTAPDGDTLRKAFAAAAIAFSTDPVPPAGVSFSIATIQGAPMLMVGSKAPPQLP